MPRRPQPASKSQQCLSTPPALCSNASPQLRLARLLLAQARQLDAATMSRRLRAIRASDPIQGPLAVHWLLTTLARMTPAGKDRIFFLEQADIVKEEEVVMRKLRKGWSQYGVSDPWFVVHPWKEPWLPRYHSAPALRSPRLI